MRLAKVTTSDDYTEYDAYIDDDTKSIYMDENQLNEFFSPYDVRILQAGQLQNKSDTPKALIYMENEILLESSPVHIDNEFIAVFDVSDFELIESE